MMRFVECIDAGTDYCPCALAELNECIICPNLKEGSNCDCINWAGCCIYQEFIWNGRKRVKDRHFETYKVIKTDYIKEDLIIFKVKVSKKLASDLNGVGAYVFLKESTKPDYFAVPISVLEADTAENTISMLIKISGPKTKSLLNCKSKIDIKGPYWNGILGVRYIKNAKNINCIIIARGTASAPAVNCTAKLSLNNNVTVLLDRGQSKENFLKKYFLKYKCRIEDVSFTDESRKIYDEMLIYLKYKILKNDIKLVITTADNNFQKSIIEYVDGIDKKIQVAAANNNTFCCGEGICGSCKMQMPNGRKINTCKMQVNPKEIFLKEMDYK